MVLLHLDQALAFNATARGRHGGAALRFNLAAAFDALGRSRGGEGGARLGDRAGVLGLDIQRCALDLIATVDHFAAPVMARTAACFWTKHAFAADLSVFQKSIVSC